jgi:hypothetical protein
MTKLVMIDTISQHLIRFVVELEDNEPDQNAEDILVDHIETDASFHEFSQAHLGNVILSKREISKEDYLRLFDEDNDYLSSWSEDQKLKFINKSQEN